MNIGSLFPAPATVKSEARLEATTAREQRQQALAEAKLNDARAAVESLKQRSSNAAEEKKAAAKKKIEQIKARLQMLQMAMIGDPKAAARIAAQLARELGTAVKAYAAAGGSTAGLGATPGASATAADAASGEAQAAGAAAEASPEAPNGEPAPTDGQGEAPKPANPYQQAIDAAQTRINEQARRHGESQADRDVLNEVKRLAAQIKAMARQATNKADGVPEGDEAERAVARMDREVYAAVQAMPKVGIILMV